MILILIKLTSSLIINKNFIKNYNNGDYEEKYAKKMLILNFFEPYIAHYNYGNILYQNGNFDEAIIEYEKALNLFPPKYKECNIRINIVLSMLQKIYINNSEDEKILEKLMEARRFLCEKGCANEDNDNGHSDEAENLKKDIDKMIEELQKDKLPKDEDKKDNKNNNKDKEKKQKDDSKMSKKKKELEEIEKKGREEREDSLTDLRNFYSDKYYYDGKQW
ncbi:MAG: tetratricopeptide repeat protein [Clostridia bacterium]|nr:tetratricopeptide repeat protein [Clostridia bacterium]